MKLITLDKVLLICLLIRIRSAIMFIEPSGKNVENVQGSSLPSEIHNIISFSTCSLFGKFLGDFSIVHPLKNLNFALEF